MQENTNFKKTYLKVLFYVFFNFQTVITFLYLRMHISGSMGSTNAMGFRNLVFAIEQVPEHISLQKQNANIFRARKEILLRTN